MPDIPLAKVLELILPKYGFKPSKGLINALSYYIFNPDVLKTYPTVDAALKEIFGPQLPDGLAAEYNYESQSYDLGHTRVKGLPKLTSKSSSPLEDPRLENLELLIASHINSAKYDFSRNPKAYQALISQIASLKIEHPDDDFTQLLQKDILPQLESIQAKSDVQDILSQIAATLKDFDLNAKDSDLALQTITAELSRISSPA